MSRKDQLKEIAEHTIQCVENGFYINPKGDTVSLSEAIKFSVEKTIYYSDKASNDLFTKVKANERFNTVFSVVNTTTLEAVRTLLKQGHEHIAALNFASARNPGGGFLKGSSAQEESLARASSLYHSLISKNEFYDYHKTIKTGKYSDALIYSPNVSVFKNDRGELLDEPYQVSFITSPAVNKGDMLKKNPRTPQSLIDAAMLKRIEKIIALAIAEKHEVIVLGAFGCGVFKNKAKDVAQYFHRVLSQPKYRGQFKEVVFAVYDTSEYPLTFKEFDKTFSK